MPWNAIALVTSGLTLVAFLAATMAWIARRRLSHTERLIELSPETERGQLVDRIIEAVNVDTTSLTRAQKFQLASELLAHRMARFRITAITILIAALALSALAALAISRTTRFEDAPPLLRYEYAYERDGVPHKGTFEQVEANSWVEHTDQADADLTYHFREIGGEPGWITLYDSGRNAYVRFRKRGGVAQYATAAAGPWMNIHTVVPLRPR